MRHYLSRQQTPMPLGILLCFLAWLYPMFGASCPLSPETVPRRVGVPTGADCRVQQGGIASCASACKAYGPCKLFYLTDCSMSNECTCTVCTKLVAIDFSQSHLYYYLKTQVIAANTQTVNLHGGLIAGQPLIFTISLKDSFVTLNFMNNKGNIAFMTEIRFGERSVVSNSHIGYWGAEDRYTPHFRFTQGQHVSVFCVVTADKYQLYFDKVLFKNFPHRLPISQITIFNLGRTYSKILSFSR